MKIPDLALNNFNEIYTFISNDNYFVNDNKNVMIIMKIIMLMKSKFPFIEKVMLMEEQILIAF